MDRMVGGGGGIFWSLVIILQFILFVVDFWLVI